METSTSLALRVISHVILGSFRDFHENHALPRSGGKAAPEGRFRDFGQNPQLPASQNIFFATKTELLTEQHREYDRETLENHNYHNNEQTSTSLALRVISHVSLGRFQDFRISALILYRESNSP